MAGQNAAAKGLYYIVLVDAVVNATNYAAIRLGLAGNVGTTLALSALLYGALIAAGLRLRGKKLLEEYRRNAADSLSLGWGYFGISFAVSIAVGATIVGLLLGLGGLGGTLRYGYPSNPIRTQSLGATLLLAAFSLLVVGPAEETIFRGCAFGLLLDSSGWERWRRLGLIQAAGFGLAHLYYFYLLGPLGTVALVEIVGMGYGLGWAYYRSGGGLAGPIAVHGLWDSSTFLLLYPQTAVFGGLLKALFFVLVLYSLAKIVSRNRSIRRAWPQPQAQPAPAP